MANLYSPDPDPLPNGVRTEPTPARDDRGFPADDRSAEHYWHLFQHHQGALLGAARNFTQGREHDAEDLLHDTMLRGREKFRDVRDVAAFRGWFRTMLRRTMINQAQKKRAKPFDDEALDEAEDTSDGPLAGLVQRERAERLHGGLSRMRDPFAGVLQDFYFQDMSLGQIAEECACPVGTIKSRLDKGRNLLFEAMGGDIDELEN